MEFFGSLHQFRDWALLFLRVAVGMIFLVHGLSKRGMWKVQPGEQMSRGMLNIMRLLSICEPLGAIAMFSGFLTQIAAAGFMIIMLGAIRTKIKLWQRKFTGENGWEFDFIIFTAALTLFVLGAGGFSLDRLLFGI